MGAISTAYSDPILSIGNTIYFGDAPLTPEKYVMNVVMGAAMAVGIDQVGKLLRSYWLQSGNMNGGIKPRGPIDGSTENVAFYGEIEGVEVTSTRKVKASTWNEFQKMKKGVYSSMDETVTAWNKYKV